MEATEMPKELDVLTNLVIDVIPAMKMAAFTFSAQRIEQGKPELPARDLVPLCWMIEDLRKLHRLLPALILQMEAMQGQSETSGASPKRH